MIVYWKKDVISIKNRKTYREEIECYGELVGTVNVGLDTKLLIATSDGKFEIVDRYLCTHKNQINP